MCSVRASGARRSQKCLCEAEADLVHDGLHRGFGHGRAGLEELVVLRQHEDRVLHRADGLHDVLLVLVELRGLLLAHLPTVGRGKPERSGETGTADARTPKCDVPS